jgi:eukaryotic-like serine/threonine-protein kinase
VTERDRRVRALAILDRILDLEESQRAARLLAEADGDEALIDLVRAMLRADAEPSRVLDRSAAELLGLGDGDAPDDMPYGGRIGDYRLLRVAGHGGMAAVYAAERTTGDVRQIVALKIVKRGLDTDELLRRFTRETRVLASLQHPNIARFLDAGSTADGRPYLVMEYIEGRPLTAFCDERQLTVGQRLDLFSTVCETVQFAHQRLIVHRDLKPTNILVTGRGEVKLLDFGIAKLLTDDADPHDPLTRTGIRVLTPEYAAPEQLRGEPISTTADVYALGLLLYELLAGTHPRAAADGPDRSPDVLAPSTAVRRVARGERGTMLAQARATTPDRLRRTIAGDLDRIVLKALEPDAGQRYRSAEQLLDDLGRYRDGRPVRARPNTVTYRLLKYTRRHRAGVAATGAAIALLVALSGFHAVRITQERDRARAEAGKAQATTQFLQRLLGDAYPSVALGDSFSMTDLLARATARVDSLAAQPAVQAELLRTLGDIYREQGRFTEALALLERAVETHRRSEQPLDRAAGQALSALGHLQYETKDFAAALETHRESLRIFRRVMAADDSLVLFALNNIATAATELRHFDEARSAHEEVLARRARLFADTSQLVHVTHHNLGHLYETMGRDSAAERAMRTALQIRRSALPSDHPATALTMTNLAALLARTDRLEEAEGLYRHALEAFRRVFGPDHHRVGLAAYSYGGLLQRMGRLEEAEAMLRTTVSIDRRTYGDRHMEVGLDLRRLGSILAEREDWAGAIAALREADDIFGAHDVPPTDPRRADVRTRLAEALVRVGSPAAPSAADPAGGPRPNAP